MPKVPVSVLIPIKNEAANLPRCLASVAWADQVIVVDSQSTDGSIEICQAAGADVVQFHFNGIWPKKKNWALENVPFRHDWIFILDADEVLPPSAETEFAAVIAANGHGHAGYWINRRFMFMGAWLKHAYYPNWNLRLFRPRLGRFERLVQGETASGDNEVHEHILIQGTTARLKSEMDHYAFPTVAVFVEKHNRYSNWEARLSFERSLETSRASPIQNKHVERRRRLKSLASRLPFRPTLRFLYVYLFQGGILDGRRGYHFARLQGFYEFLSYSKEIEMRYDRYKSSAQISPRAP